MTSLHIDRIQNVSLLAALYEVAHAMRFRPTVVHDTVQMVCSRPDMIPVEVLPSLDSLCRHLTAIDKDEVTRIKRDYQLMRNRAQNLETQVHERNMSMSKDHETIKQLTRDCIELRNTLVEQGNANIELGMKATDAANARAEAVKAYEAEQKKALNWERTAEQYYKNVQSYQNDIDSIGEAIGDAARTYDDGHTRAPDILRAKVPELAIAAINRLREREEREKQALHKEIFSPVPNRLPTKELKVPKEQALQDAYTALQRCLHNDLTAHEYRLVELAEGLITAVRDR